MSRIVEIIGPAGAGKSTLYHELSCRDTALYPGNFPDVRNISNLPFFFGSFLQLCPTLMGLPHNNNRKLTRREFAWLAILKGWPGILQKNAKNYKCIILDQGPVYLLAETYEFGPACLRDQKADNLWWKLYKQWAETLDTIILLDAADTDLLKRIRNREKDHLVKKESAEKTFEFLARYRKTYEKIISRLAANRNDLQVLRFDTSKFNPEEIADQLLIIFASP